MHAATATAHAHRHWQRGLADYDAGRFKAAEQSFRDALRQRPHDGVYRLNLARALWRQRRPEDALRELRALLEQSPADAIAWSLGAECLRELRQPAALVDWLQRVPAGQVPGAEHHFQLGRALEDASRLREAIDAYFAALRCQIDHAPAHAHLGFCFDKLDLKEEAAQCFRTALTLGCGEYDLNLRATLAYRQREVCLWGDAQGDIEAFHAALRQLPDDTDRAALPFATLALWDDPALQLRAARSTARHAARGVQALPALAMAPLHGRRLRIGYVSSDFHHHATVMLFAGVLERHDRGRFEVFLYSHSADDGSALRQRAHSAAEHVVDVNALSDAATAERVRADRIDILVDLKGYTRGARPALFAYRAAPVQVSFLGYPGSTGAPWIDYVVGDPVVTPLASADDYSEKIAQLPLCYQANDSQRPRPQPLTRAQAGLPEAGIVLCCFNQPYKFAPPVLDAWAQVLHEVPASVLWLLEWNAQVRKNMELHLQARGLGAQRVVWAPPMRDYAGHLSRMACADLFADTWPCNAHTTASDALWAALPVVTLRGRSFASRVAASLNAAVGLPALNTDSVEAYVRLLVDLSRDDARRQALRTHLQGMRESRLFDSTAYARDLEALYLRMAERRAAGLGAGHLPAGADRHHEHRSKDRAPTASDQSINSEGAFA